MVKLDTNSLHKNNASLVNGVGHRKLRRGINSALVIDSSACEAICA